MILRVIISIPVVWFIPPPAACGQSVPDSLEQVLRNRNQALALEVRFVREDPDAYYLVIDLPAGKLYLKAGAHMLRSCAIQKYRLTGGLSRSSLQLKMIARLAPVSAEPGNAGVRLRGRRLPLDFSGRLIEGPHGRSRLYFSPTLLIQPHGFHVPAQTGGIVLDSSDIKALDSALRAGSNAILIPIVESIPEEPFP